MKRKDVEDFISNVLCRNGSNQHIAQKILQEKIEGSMSDSDWYTLKVDWTHYMMNEFDTETFGIYLKRLFKKYEYLFDR